MTAPDPLHSPSRIPLVSGAVVAVRRRPWLAYALAASALALALYDWQLMQNTQQQQALSQQQLLRLEKRLLNNQRQLLQLQDSLALRQQQLDALHSRMAHWDQNISAEQRRRWLLGEADHYLRLASQHLQLSRDIEGARALLDVADQQLAAQNDPQLLPLRQAIAHDRLQLSTALAVDVSGIYLRLAALSERCASLPLTLAASQRPPTDTPAPATTAASTSADHSPLSQAWARLRRLLIVRQHETVLGAQADASTQALSREALRLDLAQAQLALLRGEPVLYRASLRLAEQRLGRDFALLPEAQRQALHTELRALAAINIRPTLPTLDASLRALAASSPEQP